MTLPTPDLRVGGEDGLPYQAPHTANLKVVADFSKTNLGASAVMALIPIPANTLIMGIACNLVTAEGATLTANLGLYKKSDDSAIDADGFAAGLDLNGTPGMTFTGPGQFTLSGSPLAFAAWSPAYAQGVLVTEDAYIGIVRASGTGPFTKAKAEFTALCWSID